MGIIEQIGNQLGIHRCTDEDALLFQQRILLSACSAWALTMLHRNGGEISVEALKTTIQSKCRLFQNIESGLLTVNAEWLAEYVYDTLRENGAFLHTAYWLRPTCHSLIGTDQVSFVRGMKPEEPVLFSGLAPIMQQPAEMTSVSQAFDLPDMTLDSLWTLLWKRSVVASTDVLISEFLNQSNGSWQPSAKSKFPTGIGRTTLSSGSREYYLIRGQEIRRIPETLKNMGYHHYLRILLVNQNNNRRITARHEDGIVHINMPFLPNAEVRFLRYVGWPEGTSILAEKNRFCMAEAVWPVIRQRLVHLKFTVEDKS